MRLDNGSRFPKLEVKTVDGGVTRLPEDIGRWGVVLFYRGHW